MCPGVVKIVSLINLDRKVATTMRLKIKIMIMKTTVTILVMTTTIW